jgi:hypothetical protein
MALMSSFLSGQVATGYGSVCRMIYPVPGTMTLAMNRYQPKLCNVLLTLKRRSTAKRVYLRGESEPAKDLDDLSVLAFD